MIRLVIVTLLYGSTIAYAQGAVSQLQAAPAKNNAWSIILNEDLDRVIDILSRDYSASVDTQNREFSRLKDEAIKRARAQAVHVDSFSAYSAVMKRFAGTFEDEHFRINLNVNPVRVKWPRVLLGFDKGKYSVLLSEIPDIKIGSEVSSCDGVPVDTWIRTEIIPYAEGVPSLEADVVADTPLLLVNDGNPFIVRPKQCVVDGHPLTLAWEDVPYADLRARIIAATLGTYKPAYGWHNFADHGVWIQIPSFNPKTEHDLEAFRSIIADAPSFRDRSIIVFDVRRNGGGNSEWFMRLLTSLYGPDMVRFYAREKPQLVREYVATSEVAQFYADLSTREEHTLGKSLPTPGDTADVAAHVRQALAEGKPTYLELSEESRQPPIPTVPPVNPIHAKVYVLTDYGCGSACLSFLDEMTRFPNVMQVGLPTHADRPYTNPMVTVLPSGLASLSSGTMIRRHRTRGANQPWIPKYRFEGNIGDTTALEQWIVKLVEEVP
jgi:hypothetical protein